VRGKAWGKRQEADEVGCLGCSLIFDQHFCAAFCKKNPGMAGPKPGFFMRSFAV